MIRATGNSNVIGFMPVGGTGFMQGEITANVNRDRVHKSMVPIGSKRTMHFAIQTMHRAKVRSIWVNYQEANPEIASHLTEISPFYGDCTLLPHPEKKPLGTAGSLADIANRAKLKADDVVVVISGDIVTDFDMESMINAHAASGADVTIAVKQIGEKHRRMLGGCDTVSLVGMPTKFQSEALRAYLDKEVVAKGRIAEIDIYNRRLPWDRAVSNLADASIYILSGRFIKEQIIPNITERPAPIDEAKAANDIETLKAALLVAKNRSLNIQDMLRKAVEGVSAQSEQEYAGCLYNIEHAFYRASRSKGFKMMAYLMPDNCYWRDVGTKYDVWRVNMDMLTSRYLHLLDLENGVKNGLWEKTEWGWKGTDNVHIDPKAELKFPVIVGNNCSVEADAKLHMVVLGANTIVRQDTVLEYGVTFPHPDDVPGNVLGGGVLLKNFLFLGGELLLNEHFEGATFYVPEGNIIINPLYIPEEELKRKHG
ncbi:sugar phosphate nucleotidyltransferase [Candidatus Margulisiibacteriota bacterium]